jgi:tetratricopeptide (TPR) repeat protein
LRTLSVNKLSLLILGVSVALLGARGTLAEPMCVAQCDELVEEGLLADSVSREGCYVRVCQLEGRRFYQNAEYAKALESLDYLQEKLAQSPSYQLDRGLALYALGDFEEALKCFENIQRGFPNNVKAGAQRAHTLVRMGQLDDGREQFQKLLDQPETHGEFKDLDTRSYLKGNIAIVKLMQGDLAGGKADLIRALEIDKRNKLAGTYLHNVVPYIEIGALDPAGVVELVAAFEDLGLRRLIPAAQKLQTLLNRQPSYAPGYQRLAEILRSYQRYEDCEKALRVGEAHLPSSINLRAERLRCTLLRVGPSSEEAAPAVKELKALAEAHPENDRVRKVLAAVGYEP